MGYISSGQCYSNFGDAANAFQSSFPVVGPAGVSSLISAVPDSGAATVAYSIKAGDGTITAGTVAFQACTVPALGGSEIGVGVLVVAMCLVLFGFGFLAGK